MSYNHPLQRFESLIETFDKRISSAALILESDDAVLLVKSKDKSYWTFPGGMIDEGETPKQAVVRELEEEVAIRVDSEVVEFGWVVSRSSRVAMSYQFIFRTPLEGIDIANIKLQASEIESWRIVSRQDILSGDRHYSKAAEAWAHGFKDGYMEQVFGSKS